jgi:hypothetical protein
MSGYEKIDGEDERMDKSQCVICAKHGTTWATQLKRGRLYQLCSDCRQSQSI